MLKIRDYHYSDEKDVVTLWHRVFPDAPPHNIPEADIRRKLGIQPELFLVALEGSKLVGTAMGGYDGHRGWVYYLAVCPEHRRRGIGRALMQHLELKLTRMGCPKLNLQVRAANSQAQSFYQHLGYRVEDRISLGKRLGLEDDG
jgi:ribosomal protein S18 acetylase RimI-like enzyme